MHERDTAVLFRSISLNTGAETLALVKFGTFLPV